MNIMLITTYKRPELFLQTLRSMRGNAANWPRHHLTTVIDGGGSHEIKDATPYEIKDATILLVPKQGASAARNIGASSIPKYRRQTHVCFFDDDVYCAPGWDERLERALMGSSHKICAVSGHAHPYNHTILGSWKGSLLTTVLSTVNISCSWEMWDDVGWFSEPGGPGGSEDVDWCLRATEKGYGLAVTDPQVVIHCGITGSGGKPIVGQDLVVARNEELVKLHKLEGKVKWA